VLDNLLRTPSWRRFLSDSSVQSAARLCEVSVVHLHGCFERCVGPVGLVCPPEFGVTRIELLVSEVHEHPAEIVRVLLDPVIERLDVLSVEETQHAFLSWPLPLPGMISTNRAFFSIASSMIPRRARSMSSPRL
jgi:hypothetical protein